jgi:hypothetical protein
MKKTRKARTTYLEPCPFFGRPVTIERRDGYWQINCGKSGCVNRLECYNRFKRDAVDRWNKRYYLGEPDI